MTWKCLLVDDEPLAIEVLEKYIEAVDQLQVVGTCRNAFQAMEFLQKNPVDLIFLDIHMPKLTGTSFVRTLQHPPKIIFTTAFKEHAIDAFELDAVDYLLKPISLERFLRAVNKLTQTTFTHPEEMPVISEATSGFIYFRSERKMVKLFYDEILYIESIKDYIKIVREGNAPLLVKQSISSTEELLPPNLFLRIHRSFIVALQKISAFTNNDVEIQRMEIPIGRLYKPQLQKIAELKKFNA
ncbi:MAG: LytR/AlgR family response regulator transcription factor [Chitinophagaceae bacterium]